MLVMSGLTALLFAVLGVVFSSGKGISLIAGYNTTSPEEKESINEKSLCRAVGSLMFVLAASCCVMALSEIFDNIAFLWIGIVLFVFATIYGVIYMNISPKINKRK